MSDSDSFVDGWNDSSSLMGCLEGDWLLPDRVTLMLGWLWGRERGGETCRSSEKGFILLLSNFVHGGWTPEAPAYLVVARTPTDDIISPLIGIGLSFRRTIHNTTMKGHPTPTHRHSMSHFLIALAVHLLLISTSSITRNDARRSNTHHVFSAAADSTNEWGGSAANLLAQGDEALSRNEIKRSIELYEEGIQSLTSQWGDEDGVRQDNTSSNSDDAVPTEREMEVIISLHTNYATALSYLEGSTEKVLSAYRTACLSYRRWKKRMEEIHTSNKEEAFATPKAIQAVATQSYFYLGMTYQDLAAASSTKQTQEEYLQHAVKAYAAATKLDPMHWSSYANMGVILGDVGVDSSGNEAISLRLYEEGILSYQKAIDILTGGGGIAASDKSAGPTDPPENVREVVAELQYRIGLCLSPFLFVSMTNGNDEGSINEKKCTLTTSTKADGSNPTPITRTCLELSAHQFHTALQFHPHHEGASNALTMVTADATFGASTDTTYVRSLFEGYASR